MGVRCPLASVSHGFEQSTVALGGGGGDETGLGGVVVAWVAGGAPWRLAFVPAGLLSGCGATLVSGIDATGAVWVGSWSAWRAAVDAGASAALTSAAGGGIAAASLRGASLPVERIQKMAPAAAATAVTATSSSVRGVEDRPVAVAEECAAPSSVAGTLAPVP